MATQANSEPANSNDSPMPVPEPRHPPKCIILFSDGTGNSSGKLFKTNVWRMYEALDLGPATAGGRRSQIAYYDNGVGTSSFKLWAVLSGIFGFGLKRNVLSIYRFICRNYQAGEGDQQGDRIYGFGFSRGAFTIRLVIALICDQGIIRYETERELQQRSLDALRSFSRKNNPNFFPFLAMAGRVLRDSIVGFKRLFVGAEPQSEPSHYPEIEFVGVWDTVAAYGGPIAEITRAIDNWIWPLSMPDYHLSPKVKRASHALALDDERDSFHPLLWDEFRESLRVADAQKIETEARKAAADAAATGDTEAAKALVAKADAAGKQAIKFKTRLQQVWFAGMHSDVGGGYPDESLSFVSLRWMMDQVRNELRFFPDVHKRIEEVSNSFGPIHDSRQGPASYYRYQPRKITAFLHPESQPDDVSTRRESWIVRETLSLRDPTLGEQKIRPQGFLLSCKVHESVIARITSGADDYAPIGLPDRFEIVPQAAATEPPVCLYDWQAWKNIEAKGNIDPRTGRSPRGDHQERNWNDVFRRRMAYFATVALTILLLSLPLRIWGPAIDTDDRWVWGRVTSALARLLPDFLDPWINALRDRPWHVLFLLVLVFVARAFGSRYGGRIKDKMRILWCASMAPRPLPAVPTSSLRDWRNGYAYQRALQWVKWWFLPNIIFGPLLLFSIAYLALILATQTKLSWDEVGACTDQPRSPALSLELKTSEICHRTGFKVTKDHEYAVELYVEDPWKDGRHPASPNGLRAREFDGVWARMFTGLAAPLRRVVMARYLEPLYEIRTIKRDGKVAIHIGRLNIAKKGAIYSGAFRARRDGELYLFVNDAVWIGNLAYFYTHEDGLNQGSARIVIVDRTPPQARRPAPAVPKINPSPRVVGPTT